MLLTPAELAILRTELAKPIYAGLTDAQCLDKISGVPQIANPVAAPQVPAPYNAPTVQSLLSPASLGRFATLPLAGQIIDVLNGSDVAAANRWVTTLATLTLKGDTAPVITTAERDAILARLAQTIPDPNWPATVPSTRTVNRLYGANKTWSTTQNDPFNPGKLMTITVNHPDLEDIHAART